MHCPICGFEMVKKSGKRGEYFKCVNYECNFSGDTESIEGFEEFLDKDNVKLREKFLKFCFTESNEFNQINLFKNIDWLIKGKLGELLYKEYYEEFILKLDKNFLFYNFDRFIDEYENSLCIEDACNKTGIIFEKIIVWLELGNNDEKPFTYFFDKFYEVHNVKVENQIDTFLNIFDGFNEKEALKAAKVSDVKLASWLRLNYLGYPYNKLYSKYLEIISDVDYSDCLYFDNQYMSTNTFQMLFVLSDVGKDKYADFHDDLYKIIKKQDEFEVFRPEVVIETYMKSLDFKKTNFINFLTKKNMKDFEHYLKLYLVEKKDYENDNIYKLLNFIALGYDDSIACQKSDISQKLFNNWMTYQASDFPSNSLLDDYDSSLILNNYIDFINLKIDYFIELLRNGLDVHEICDRLVLFLSDVELYLNLGFMNFKPYDVFYEKYNEKSIKDFYDAHGLNLFLDEIKNGSFKEDAIKKLDFKQKKVDKFLKDGKNGLIPYNAFYKDYSFALISNFDINLYRLIKFLDEINDNDIETLSKKVKLPFDVINYWLSLNYCRNIINESNNLEDDFISKKSFIFDKKIFMRNIFNGRSIRWSCKGSNFDYILVKSWINKGKKGFEPYDKFYREYIESKHNSFFNEKNTELKENFLNLITRGYSKKRALDKIKYSKRIESWLNEGKCGIEPFNQFYEDYNNVILKNFYDKYNLDLFLTNVGNGMIIKEAMEKSEISDKNWMLINRNKNKWPYSKFFDDYRKVLLDIFNEYDKNSREIFLNEYSKGSSYEEALLKSSIDEDYIQKCSNLKDEAPFFKKFYNNYIKSEKEGFLYRDELNDFFKLISKGESIDAAGIKCNLDIKFIKGILNNSHSLYHKEFFNRYLDAIIKYYQSSNSQRIKFLENIENCELIKRASENAGLDYYNVQLWLNKGKKNEKPFNEFYDNYNCALITQYTNNEEKRNNFLENIENCELIKRASENAGLDYYNVQLWLNKGKKNEKPFNEFYDDYNCALINQYTNNEEKRNKFLELIGDGKTNKSACEILDLNPKIIYSWVQKGEKGLNMYIEFFEKYTEIKNKK